MIRLDSESRGFFEAVADAAFCNPFSDRRDAIDRQLAGAEGTGDALIDALATRVHARMARTLEAGKLPDYEESDRKVIEYALLFDTYHAYRGPLGALVAAQLAAGPKPAPVPFADALQSELTRAGLPRDRAQRMLAIFYQMHRAHTFIAEGLVGASPSMRRLREDLWNQVFTRDIRRYDRLLWDRLEDCSTLIVGDTGTGKGAAARAIGYAGFIEWSPRQGCFARSFTDSFLALNASEFPEGLIESELFGHRRGAFTGAVSDHAGVFSRTHAHGALFLDELGELSPSVQVKLLRVLQDRVFTPVGSHDLQRFEGRVLAATHRSLDAMRARGSFREDLYYRLCSARVELPTLRQRIDERPEELSLLVEELLVRTVGRDEARELAGEVHARILHDLGPRHPWPGNVRELEQQVRSVLVADRCVGSAADQCAPEEVQGWLGAAARGELDAPALLRAYCTHLHARLDSYSAVARTTGLDRRTVRKYVEPGAAPG